jgi:thymidylate kinase
MNCSEIIKAANINEAGVQLASLKHDFIYTWLFYWLNNASVPVRYQEHFSGFSSIDLRKLNIHLSQKSNGVIQLYNDAFIWNIQLKKAVENLLRENKENKGFYKIIHSIQYFTDVVKRLFPKRGCIITFSGVDGAGKSTVIEKVKLMVEKKYRKPVIVLRHRPSVLPILSAWTQGKENAEKKAATTLPRQGNNNSYISSLIRFAYYYADYLFGQLYIQLRYVLRGYIVLYDRYYFDFINDSKRSNITLPKSFTKLWYCFLLKPKFNFFLYASVEEILIRKKELDAATITALTKQYLTLFNQLSVKYTSSEYIPVYNKDLATTLSLIEDTALLNKSTKLKMNQLRAAAL